MLANVLPGLRDLRVPLVTGILWLVIAWLVFYPLIPNSKEAIGFSANIYELYGALGSAAFLATLSFVAYLVGIVLARLEVIPRYLAWEAARSRSDTFNPVLSRASRDQVFKRSRRILLDIRRTADCPNLPYDLIATCGMDESAREVQEAMSKVLHVWERRSYEEIPLVAMRLLAKNKELFDRYDRADAEATFRYAIALPLLAIPALLLWRFGLIAFQPLLAVVISLAVALIVALIVRDGYEKQREANDAIYQAVLIGEAEFPVIEQAMKNARGDVAD